MSKLKTFNSLLLLLALAPSTANADDMDIAELSLEELMNTQIYSASKRPEKLSEVPAAAYVLSSEDIAKSGVTSIPEALRIVPGVQVAQTNAHTWAISIRGFNRQFSNKLLVLIDGRSVYTPLFSGVFWDTQDYLLEDIDRIEVIRGPGGTLWGANAVNGVINIITKEARKTKGTYVSSTIGTHDDILEFRHGGNINDTDYYRVYGKIKDMSEFKDSANARSSNDDWEQGRVGFRYDFRDWNYNPVTMQGDVYSGQRNGISQIPATPFPYFIETGFGEHHKGGNLMLKWDTPLTDEINGKIGAYIDYIYRDSDNIIQQERITYNFDFQASYENGIHSIIAGTEFRFINDNLDNTNFLVYTPESSSVTLSSVFIQDKIEVVEDKLFLTIGSKFGYNDYTDFEFQPNARILWQVTKDHSLWASVSKAVRTPSRGENNSSVTSYVPYALPPVARLLGNTSYEAENLIAYELGYRGDITDDLFLDIATFYNDYSDLRTFETVAGFVKDAHNNGYGESYGVEVSAVKGITDNWDVKLSSTFLKQTFHVPAGNTDTSLERDEERSPNWQHSIQSSYQINEELKLDNNIFYVSDLKYYTSAGAKRKIDSYVRFDTKLSWKPREDLEVNLVGQNLFDSNHQEFDEVIYSTASEVPRSAYIQLKYKY